TLLSEENLESPPARESRNALDNIANITRSSDNIIPWQRSKSRSVDHGFSPPFDLDSLRSKVEGRFESVGRGSKDKTKQSSIEQITFLHQTKHRCTILPQPIQRSTYIRKHCCSGTSGRSRIDL
ncbi:hypothetical protein L9F63_013738, partial [Diploptera punctata]